MSVSSKAIDIPPFIVMDVLERAQKMEREEGADVIHLEVGEPDFETPECILESAMKAMKDSPKWMLELVERFNLTTTGFCKYATAWRLETIQRGFQYSDQSENTTY